MKRNGTGRTRRNGRADFGTKQVIALLLALALSLGLLCATAEDSDGLLLPGAAARAADGELYVADEAAAGDSTLALELPEDAKAGEDALVIDGTSLDGLAGNLIVNGLPELDVEAETPAAAQASNDSNPEDFVIDENGVLVEYVGADGDVVIPDGVTSIGEEAFYECESLTSVTIPDSVTSIGAEAFARCSNMLSVTIPDSVISIGDGAFYECESLTSVTIPDSVTRIGWRVFDWCRSLKIVTIGKGLSFDDLFDCSLLRNEGYIEAFEVTENNDVYASRNGILYTYDMSTLLRCPRERERVTVPGSVTSIGSRAFYSCDRLLSVTIPNSVTSIGERAFSGCFYLQGVTIPNSVTNIGERAFSRCDDLTRVIIPDSVTSIGEATFFNCTDLKDVYIPASVQRIGKNAFSKYSEEGYWHYEDDVWDDYDEELYKINIDLTIHGYVDSYAESYAEREGFAFEPIVDRISLSKAKLTVKDQVYTGKTLKPAVTVKYGKKTLKKGTDYTVTYKNNKAIGTATVIVKGKGNYQGTAKATFKINPRSVKGLYLVSGQKLLYVSWQKSVGASGYQLQYGVKKSFSGAKKVTIAKASTQTRVLKNLKRGKIYYVRIRAWKKVGGKTYWSAWSAAKKAKVR